MVFFLSELAPSPTLQVQRKQTHQESLRRSRRWTVTLAIAGLTLLHLFTPAAAVLNLMRRGAAAAFERIRRSWCELAVTGIFWDAPSAYVANGIGAALEMQLRSLARRPERSLSVESHQLSALCFPGRHKTHH